MLKAIVNDRGPSQIRSSIPSFRDLQSHNPYNSLTFGNVSWKVVQVKGLSTPEHILHTNECQKV
jgi:hypothetical protein